MSPINETAMQAPTRQQAIHPSVPALAPAHGPTAALRVRDPRRRRQLECVLDRAPEAEADVLVIDLPPGMTVPADALHAPLLVLSDDPGVAADPTLAGVLRRDASARRIAAAVAALAEGLQVREAAAAPPAPAAVEAEQPGFAAAPPPASLLTPREMEILALVGDGLSNKAIARRLGISAHTVKYHLEAVFAKLAVRSRAEAVIQGLRRGLVVL
ncbi:response regulator transcription factor [Limobrevibacterium gyesilva]|uniref:Helix-turn-helix transcriptional regulator n=1 Tax=Limobrevibacterium gyesilva TaxID=2991712 RepID=A0AA42CF72_9PROT|nr:helix-turn-helix transcriptional regulator [Limobrevibacterium gyesilva]MCW3476209.1 helix-turn-helix transcriptional regulator [Limobrevibacterium gyesilva]